MKKVIVLIIFTTLLALAVVFGVMFFAGENSNRTEASQNMEPIMVIDKMEGDPPIIDGEYYPSPAPEESFEDVSFTEEGSDEVAELTSDELESLWNTIVGDSETYDRLNAYNQFLAGFKNFVTSNEGADTFTNFTYTFSDDSSSGINVYTSPSVTAYQIQVPPKAVTPNTSSSILVKFADGTVDYISKKSTFFAEGVVSNGDVVFIYGRVLNPSLNTSSETLGVMAVNEYSVYPVATEYTLSDYVVTGANSLLQIKSGDINNRLTVNSGTPLTISCVSSTQVITPAVVEGELTINIVTDSVEPSVPEPTIEEPPQTEQNDFDFEIPTFD